MDPIQGKELELKVIRKLKDSKKWGDISTGYFYRDLLTEKPREIDIVADGIFGLNHGHSIQVSLIFEVKYITGKLTIWFDEAKKEDLIAFTKTNIVRDTSEAEILIQNSHFFNPAGSTPPVFAKTWFQNTPSKKEGFYDAVSTLLSIFSSPSIKYQFKVKSQNNTKHLLIPIIAYQTENPIEFRNFDNNPISPHKNFLLEAHHIYPLSSGNYLNEPSYISIWDIDEIDQNISKLINEFSPDDRGGYSNNIATSIIREFRNDQPKTTPTTFR